MATKTKNNTNSPRYNPELEDFPQEELSESREPRQGDTTNPIVSVLQILGRHWLLILLICLTITVAAIVVSLPGALSMPYRAQAVGMLLARDPSASVGLPPSDIFTDNTIRVLVLATDTAENLKQEAAASDDADIRELATWDVADLKESIDVDAGIYLLFISAKHNNPKVATWLANNWLEASIDKINLIYSPVAPATNDALEIARADLEQAQKDVEAFYKSNPIVSLQREHSQAEGFTSAALSIYNSAQLSLYDNQRNLIIERAAAYREAVLRLDAQLIDLRALRTRIEQGPDDQDALYSNQVTLLLMLNKVAGTPVGDQSLNINISDAGSGEHTKADQLRNVDSLILLVQKQQEEMRAQIAEFESRVSAPLPSLIPDTVVNIPPVVQDYIETQNVLRAEITRHNFELTQLEKTRDHYQSTYDQLRARAAEQQTNEVLSGVINIGSPANITETARSRSPLGAIQRSAAIGFAIALVMALIITYLLHLLRPDLNSTEAIKRKLRRGRARAARQQLSVPGR